MTTSSEVPAAVVPAPPGPSLLGRALRIFYRPASAWEGLETRTGWWFPMILVLVVQVVLTAAGFRRILVPMMLDQWDEAVANGTMQPEQAQKISEFFQHNPAAIGITVGQQAVALPLITLLIALVVWFGVGFVLGSRFRYRLALEVVTWSSLVQLPATFLTYAIAWSTQTFKGIHFGLAALLPDVDPPTKLHAGLTVLLDAIGPFGLWYLVVAVLGCSALSGAPRKNVAWVLSALYLALAALFAAVAAFFTPGA